MSVKTAVITDVRYRAAVAACRQLAEAGWRVVAVQTREDTHCDPPAFSSVSVTERVWVEGSCRDAEYPTRLREVLCQYDNPLLFCVGAVTLRAVAAERDAFAAVCRFLVSEAEVLDALNDKEIVHERAAGLGIPVPREFASEPDVWPVVVKPHCGEKAGLKAAERYVIAHGPEELFAAREKLRSVDPSPLVQQYVTGDGIGVSVLLGPEGELLSALCHRRIREWPVTGGPSACCVSFYDGQKVRMAHELLRSFGFCGLAMVEFKGECFLEVNPRVWGSFPLTEKTGSAMLRRYAAAACGEKVEAVLPDFREGVRMHYLLGDAAASLALLRSGRLREAWSGLADLIRLRDALRCRGDDKPFFVYLLRTIQRRI